MFRILKSKLLNYNYILKQRKCYQSDATKGLSKIIDDVNSREVSKLIDVDIINFSAEKIYFKSYSVSGFTLSNNFQINGGVTALSKSVLFWNVLDIQNVNEDSLELINVLEPKIDIVIIGKGPRNAKPDIRSLLQLSKKMKINFEILPTAEAIATFNFLNYEDRNVVAFLLPVKTFTYLEEDQADIMKNRRKGLDMFRESFSEMHFEDVQLDKNFLFPKSILTLEKPTQLSESIQAILEEAKQIPSGSEDNDTKKIDSDIKSNMIENTESREIKNICSENDNENFDSENNETNQINNKIKSKSDEKIVSQEIKEHFTDNDNKK